MRFTDPDNAPQTQSQDEDRVYVNPKDMVGHLLLVWPIEYLRDVPTKYPKKNDKGEILPADAVFCDIVDLNLADDNGQRGLLMRRCRWTQGRLIRDTKKLVGAPDPLLVSMGKDGDAFVIIFQHGNPAAVAIANEWESRNPNFVPGDDAPVRKAPEEIPSDWNTMSATPPVRGATVNREQSDVWPPATTAAPRSTPAAAPVNPEYTNETMNRLRRQAGISLDGDQARDRSQDPAFQEAPF